MWCCAACILLREKKLVDAPIEQRWEREGIDSIFSMFNTTSWQIRINTHRGG